ncbi:alpha/beta fold hydrolase [Amycolatopsis taiwanensis]|uniref:alpha/beta fold hydrolase n=1 Tax=Amycolatopsis taiwanensis TaxID=342230 RepID=UPI00048A057E|nr:alpha/beta hydrolase [Amycolatopsis taiwanensis]
MPATTQHLDLHRREIDTPSGPASCLDTGGPGRPAVFVHGLLTSSYLWRNVLDRLPERRCVAIDLPLHGQTPAADRRDFSLPSLARFVADCCDALGLTDIDLVANDTGGAIAQVFAAGDPDRLHTLTLTNCEAHDNVPPRGSRLAYWLARADQATRLDFIARLGPRRVQTPAARRRMYRSGYQDPAGLPDDIARAWLEPLFADRERTRRNLRMFTSIRARDLLAVEPALTRLEVPTLIVWGTGDKFFSRNWAYWLRDTIPGATEVVELDGARLFFPDERAGELTTALLRHWDAHP